MMKQRWGLDRNVLRPTPGDPWGVEQHHWNIGAEENQQLNSNQSEILRMSSVPANLKMIGSKTTEKCGRHHFPHYKSMGAFCCHGNQSFDPICPKTFCSLSPTPMMLHIKFDQDWPTDIRDIQVRKCKIFVIQGQVTPKWVVWSGPNSNSSEL